MTSLRDLPDIQQQRLVLLLSYYGPDFSGAQMQSNAYTVQQALDEALAHLKIPHGAISFAGRTDAKVHAKGQVAHVDIDTSSLTRIPCLQTTLNAVLPKGMSVRATQLTPDKGFHSTTKAQYRWYRYKIFNAPQREVWMDRDALWVKAPLNTDAMAEAATRFLGEHDFTSFCCPKTSNPNPVCHVVHSQIERQGDYIVYDIVANRFIYKMVRNIVGLMCEIGLASGPTASQIPAILAQKDRQAAGHSAQPHGLSLMAALYPAPWDFFQNDVYVTNLKHVIQESSPHEENLLRQAS